MTHNLRIPTNPTAILDALDAKRAALRTARDDDQRREIRLDMIALRLAYRRATGRAVPNQ